VDYNDERLGQIAQSLDDGKLVDDSCRKPLFILGISLKENSRNDQYDLNTIF